MFKITSDDFNDGDYLDDTHVLSAEFGFGCAGGNRSPQLGWSNPPSGTKSFVLTCYDPDAPTGSGFWHWVVADIPAEARAIPAGAGTVDGAALPPGAFQSRTDYGAPGYGGPCPPPGHPHRYIFTLHAVSVESLGITADTSAAVVGFMVHMNTLGSTAIMGLYRR